MGVVDGAVRNVSRTVSRAAAATTAAAGAVGGAAVNGVVGAVTLVAVNAVVNRVIASNKRAARLFDGHATTVISDGHVIGRAMRRLGLRRSELDHAVRLQNGDDISQVQRGSLEPGGQLVLDLKAAEQGATKSDVAEITARLGRIEELLGAAR